MKKTATILTLGLLLSSSLLTNVVKATTNAEAIPVSQNSNTNPNNNTSLTRTLVSPTKVVTGAPKIPTYLEADTVTFNNDFTGTNGDELHMGGKYNDKINLSTTFKPTNTLPPYHATATTVDGVPGIWVPEGFEIFLSTYMSTYNGNQTDFLNLDNTTFKVTANGVDISSNFSIRFENTGLSAGLGLYLTYTPPAGSNGMLAIGSGLQVDFSIDEPDIYPNNNGGSGGGIADYFNMGASSGGITLRTDNGGTIPSETFGASPAALQPLKFFFGYAPTIFGVDDKEIELNSTFDSMDGVTANDKHDGDLTASVTSSGNVNTSLAGTYPVDYSVTDSDGHTTTATRNITVNGVTPVPGGDITAKYVDTDGNQISDDVVKSGNVGDDYTTEQKDIDGYTFKEVQGSATGTFTDQAQTVTYVYTKNPVKAADVTAKYVDTDGNQISDDVVKSGNVGDDYTTEQKDIDGYTFKEVQGSATGTFTDQAQTVTYVYTKNPVKAADVTAKYVDTDGNQISDDVVKSGNVGDDYTTEQKDIDGYTFKEVQGSATGTFTDQAQTVTYVYTKNPVKAADVTAKYVDTDGNQISDDVVKSGNVGDDYTTEQKDIDGYTFKEVQGSATGTFTDQAQTVTYVYTKNPVKAADVTAKYVDTDGNQISDDVVKSGNVGDDYTTEQKDIDGYTFKEVQGSATGTFTDQAQTVTYVYTKNPVKAADVTAKYVDTDGNQISDDVVKSGNVGDDYTTEQKDIDGYTFKEVQGSATGTFTDQAQTVTYVYTKNPVKAADVTAKYVDTDGNQISDDVVKSGNVGDDYTTEQKDIDGYTFKEVQGSATGTFTDQAQTVTYVYTKNPVKAADVTAKYVDTDGNQISDDVVKSGNVGDDYTTEQKDIDGYTFKEVQGSATGTFTDQAQTVTYVYTKNNVTPNPKPDDHSDTHESSKDKGNKNDSNTEDVSTLPQTGENEGLSLIGMISGLLLILGATLMIIFKRKRQD